LVWFKSLKKNITQAPTENKSVQIPEGLYNKCRSCLAILYNRDLDKNLKVCPKCGYHYQLSALERLYLTVDSGSFEEFDEKLSSLNPLEFPDYEEKLRKGQDRTKMSEAYPPPWPSPTSNSWVEAWAVWWAKRSPGPWKEPYKRRSGW
jgi:acetyl-CoA carboxylase carboxyl transferase subunit beta